VVKIVLNANKTVPMADKIVLKMDKIVLNANKTVLRADKIVLITN
jgi:hypothetical protein